ncbi:MAG: hypothetical protein E6R14_11530 [Thermomicrobiales bacterium]|nr:MAG: hypothetical protein E6R14_11530 [Thermomicrobiales bacterium]
MSLKLRTLCIIAVATIALTAHPTTRPLFGRSFTDPVPNAVLANVRACLAALDRFMVDGNLDNLWATLDQRGHGLDPWPAVAHEQRDIAALAFRATFPDLRVSLTGVEPSNDVFLVNIEEHDSAPFIPAGLEETPADPPLDLDTLIEVDETGTIARAGSASTPGAIAYRPPVANAPFRMSATATLVAAQIELTPAHHGERYLAVHAPGLVLPQAGNLRVSGVGRLSLLARGSGRWRALGADQTVVIGRGDLLSIASGHAVLTMTSSEPARLIVAEVDSLNTHQPSEPEGGRSVPGNLSTMIASADASMETWFGSIESATQSTADGLSAWATLQPTWIVSPSGAQPEVVADGVPSIVLDLSPPTASETGGPSSPRASDGPQVARVLLLIRLVPTDGTHS